MPFAHLQTGDIAFTLLKPIYHEHPDFEKEIDERIAIYSVLISAGNDRINIDEFRAWWLST